jgi:outer membrane protein assembly factor BamB
MRPVDPLERAVERGWLTAAQASELRGESPVSAPVEARAAAGDARRRLGKFILVDELGRGGFGAVWRAWQADLGRWVALKFLHSDDAEDVRRFLREAQMAAALTHPGIVALHEIGEADGRPYFAMELVKGTTLARLRLTPREAAAVIREAAEAIEYAHSKGVIHRDLKPHNVMRDESGRVRVMDFGLARQVRGGTTLTASGMMVGTPAYMSPEQARGEIHGVDRRTDVYGLGATLYELLTGRPPFEGPTPIDVAMRVVSEDPAPPRALGAAVPPELETICLKAMEKDPAKRYATARALGDDLRRFLAGEPIAAAPPSLWYRLRKKAARHRALSAAIGVVALGVLASLGYFFGPAWIDAHGERRLAWPPGRHAFEVRREGFDPQWVRVDARPWHVSAWTQPLTPDHGFVEARTRPEGAEVAVFAEGREAARGRANGPPLRVPKGTVEVRLALPDHETVSVPLYVPPGDRIALEREMRHETGRVTVSCHPDRVAMRVSGRTYSLPVEDLELPTGTHDVEYSAENHYPARTRLSVLAGRRTVGHAFLQPVERWAWRASAAVRQVLAADLDGDAVDDCIVGDETRVTALDGRTGRRLWHRDTGANCHLAARAADLDGDGVPDCVVSDIGHHTLALSGRDGTILWSSPLDFSFATLADVDGDGAADCVGNEDSQIVAASGRDGRELWRTAEILVAVDGAPLTADVNGDGGADAIVGVCDESGRVLLVALAGRDGGLLWRHELKEAPSLLGPGDFDGDGRADLAAVFSTGELEVRACRDGSVLREEKLGTRHTTAALGRAGASPVLFVGGLSSGVRRTDREWRAREWSSVLGAGDIDGDGAADVVVGARRGQLAALSGEDGATLFTFSLGARVFVGAAVTRDGDCVLHAGEEVRRLWRPDPDVLWARGESVRALQAHGDLDRDGSADAIAATDDAILALRGTDGAMLWRHPLDPDMTPGTLLGVPDVTGDGVEDCFLVTDGLTQPEGQRGAVLAVSGATGERLWTFEAGRIHGGAAAGDLDGDGRADVVVIVRESGRPVVKAVGGGSGRLVWAFEGPPGDARHLRGIHVIDLDSDGASECVVQVSKGELVALEGRSGRERWRRRVPELGAIACADVDGDAKPEVLACVREGERSMILVLGPDGQERDRAQTGWLLFEEVYCLGDIDGQPGDEIAGAGGTDALLAVAVRSKRLSWWAFRTQLWTARPVADADRDGVVDFGVTARGRTFAVSGRSGEVMGEWPGRPAAASGGKVFLLIGQALRAAQAAPRRVRPAVLVGVGAWREARRALDDAIRSGAAPGDYALRALCRLRTGDAAGAVADLEEARRRGHASAETRAALLEARALAGSLTPEGVAGAGPEAAVVFLTDPRVAREAHPRVAAQAAGASAWELLLAGRVEEAASALAAAREEDPVASGLRALALLLKGDRGGAAAVFRRAERHNPCSRLLRAVRERLGRVEK